MDRALRITSCMDCPCRDHKGAFAAVPYVPICRLADRELPWEKGYQYGGRMQARPTMIIPDWCPLPPMEK